MDAGAHVGARGDHDHGSAGALAYLAADLVSVLVGQAEVEQDDAEAVALGDERLEGLLAAARVGDVEAVAGQDGRQGRGDVVVVLDEQQSHQGPLRFIGRTFFGRIHHGHTRVHLAVTPMRYDHVKRVPVALRYRCRARTRSSSQVLRQVSDCYRIVMLRFPSDVMTQV
ncbi:hypothetical protein RKD39_001794 [Streptomyces albogriseolus]